MTGDFVLLKDASPPRSVNQVLSRIVKDTAAPILSAGQSTLWKSREKSVEKIGEMTGILEGQRAKSDFKGEEKQMRKREYRCSKRKAKNCQWNKMSRL